MGSLYTSMKVFHYDDKINSLPDTSDEIKAPLHIRIKPTNICGHNCWYCAYRDGNLQLGKDMRKRDYIPKEKMVEIINDLEEMGVKAITFSGGGDPFSYPYLLESIKLLSETSIKFASLTHGANLNGDLAEVFALKATWIRISIDGWDDESYSSYRGVREGEFTKVMENIKNFKRIGGKCYLGVNIVVDKKNVVHLYDLIKRLKETGVDSVKVSACYISNNMDENNEYHRPLFGMAKEGISKAIHDYKEEKFEIFDAYNEMEERFDKDYTWCPYMQIVPVIGADLNVYSCHDKAYNIEEGLIGSIANQSFKDLWFSDKKKFFNINPSSHCQHHCMVNRANKLILDYLNADKEHLAFV